MREEVDCRYQSSINAKGRSDPEGERIYNSFTASKIPNGTYDSLYPSIRSEEAAIVPASPTAIHSNRLRFDRVLLAFGISICVEYHTMGRSHTEGRQSGDQYAINPSNNCEHAQSRS